jgi:hypothetical protein
MSYDVLVKIIADGTKAKAEFDRAGRAAERMAKKTTDEVQKTRISMEKFGRQAGIVGTAMLGAAGTVAFAMRGWVKSAQEAEMASMRLESSVRGAYGASSNAVRAFEAQAKALQKVTVAADEDVMSIQALLVQFGLTQRQVSTLTPLVIDISRKWGIDYVTAAKAVAKAADGKATALKKLGINVDETKAKTDPYIATVEALRRAAGGFAQQEGKTFAGQTAILSNQMDELKESLGRGVLSALNDVLPAVNGVAGAFTGLDDRTGGLIGRTTAIGTGLLAVSGSALLAFSAVTKLKAAYAAAAESSALFNAAQTGLAAVAGALIGAQISSSLYQTLSGSREKTDHAFREMLNEKDGKETARQFIYAVAGQIQTDQASLSNVAAQVGGAFGTFVTLGILDPYDAVVDRMRRGSFKKVFNEAMAVDPQRTRDIIRTIAASKDASQALADQGINIKEYVRLTKDLIDTNHDGVQSIEEIRTSNENTAKAAQSLIDVIGGQAGAQRSYQQAILGVEQAQSAVTEAQKEYDAALESGDPEKVRQAQLALRGAILGLGDAQDAAREAAYRHGEMLLALEATADDPEAYKNAIAKLERMKELLTDPAEKQAIQDKINMLTWFRAMAQAPIDTSKIVGPLGAINVELERIKANLSGSVWSTFGPTQKAILEGLLAALKPRAAGGPVAANTAYLVGEQGPELFVPSSGGTIIPNGQLGGGMSPSMSIAGGSSIVVNVSSSALSTPAETGAAVVDALTAWSRRNGRLPTALVA